MSERVPPWTLGFRLRRALEHGNLTAGWMADELGVTRGTISRWMHDVGAPPKAAYLRQWAMCCRVPLDWLVEGKGSHEESAFAKYERIVDEISEQERNTQQERNGWQQRRVTVRAPFLEPCRR